MEDFIKGFLIGSIIITFFIAMADFGDSEEVERNLLRQINQNHIELLQLINTEKQAEVAFLESLRNSRANRIKKGDELR